MALNSLKHEGAVGLSHASRMCKPPSPIEPLSPRLVPILGPEPAALTSEKGLSNIDHSGSYNHPQLLRPSISVPTSTREFVFPSSIDTLASIALATSQPFHGIGHYNPFVSKFSNFTPESEPNMASFDRPIPPYIPVDPFTQTTLPPPIASVGDYPSSDYRHCTHSFSNPSDFSSSPDMSTEQDTEAVFISHILLSLHRGNREDRSHNIPSASSHGLLPSHRPSFPTRSDTSSSFDDQNNHTRTFVSTDQTPTGLLPAKTIYDNKPASVPVHPEPLQTFTLPESSYHFHRPSRSSPPKVSVKDENFVQNASRRASLPSLAPAGVSGVTIPFNIEEVKPFARSTTQHPCLSTPEAGGLQPPEPVGTLSGFLGDSRGTDTDKSTVCPECRQLYFRGPRDTGLWVECSGCALWFHCPCAGFKSDRELRSVDKFFCRSCQPMHGSTTFVRKPTRSRTNVDNVQINERERPVKSNDVDTQNEHHYVTRIKDGTFTFLQDHFPRLRPECASAEYFERCSGLKEPTLVPAEWNPRPIIPGARTDSCVNLPASNTVSHLGDSYLEMDNQFEYEYCLDEGQDKIGMVIPEGLTVRRVAELYGLDEKVDVINVKSQEADKRWNLAQWADYYESPKGKPIRNVISLEASWSKLGKLIRRPQLVRDLDLQDDVWPADEPSPKVQLYCLMSVADSYTDFHIDFGGSSVYYHVIKGRKTFFFVPPSKHNLKKYEEWNLSSNQNFTWFPDLVEGECYRMDLYEGDTALIPSGWIHAVWTPIDSLVIGGNFLTRLSYGMQFAIANVEKNTGVGRKFRYPHFQKVHWYAAMNYLETDPLPESVQALFESGQVFKRDIPIYLQPNKFGHNSAPGQESYNARYYSKSEVLDLSEVVRYLFRTVLILLGHLEGVTNEGKSAVSKAIPKNQGIWSPLQIIQRFAQWVSWKQGNSRIPQWAHSKWNLEDAIENCGGDRKSRKVSLAMMTKFHQPITESKPILQLELEANVQPPGLSSNPVVSAFGSMLVTQPVIKVQAKTAYTDVNAMTDLPVQVYDPAPVALIEQVEGHSRFNASPPTKKGIGPRRFACDTCRRRRIRCRHRDLTTQSGSHHDGSEQVLDKPVPVVETEITPDTEPSPVGASPVSPLTDIKRTRHRACASCRITKRRCVHDEDGNFSSQKASDTLQLGGDFTETPKACSDISELLTVGLEQYPDIETSILTPSEQRAPLTILTSPSIPIMVHDPPEYRRASTNGFPSQSPRIRISPVKNSSLSSPSIPFEVKRPPKRRAKEVEETDEMKSERLARQLAAEEWSLRRGIRRRG